MRCLVILLCLLPLFVACGPALTPTPDAVGTQVAMNTARAATRTAEAPFITPSATPPPTATPSPTATPTVPPTPSAWVRFEAQDLGVAFDYPARCNVEEFPGWGWQVVDEEEERGIIAGVIDAPPREWWQVPPAELATLATTLFLQQQGESPEGFRLVALRRTDEYGLPGAVVRYDALDDEIAIEMLVIRSPSRIWAFLFAGRQLGGWFDRTKESISVTAGPVPSATPRPTARATKPPAATAPPLTVVQVGEQTKAGDWLFTVTDVEYHKTLYRDDRSRVAMGVYCVLFFDVQNQAPGTSRFGDLRWELRDAAGEIYGDSAATPYAAWQFEGKDLPWVDLNPGQRAQMVLAIDVAEDARGLQLYSRKLGRAVVEIGDAERGQDQE